jgi:hypothetical protein
MHYRNGLQILMRLGMNPEVSALFADGVSTPEHKRGRYPSDKASGGYLPALLFQLFSV